MNVVFENPVAILAIGAVFLTLTGLAFLARRNLVSLSLFMAAMVLTVLLLILEAVIVTPREQVEQSLAEVMQTLENNDVPGVLAKISPASAAFRSDVEAMMPSADIQDTAATSITVEILSPDEPMRATSTFRGKVDGIHRTSGARLFYFDQVEVDWVKQEDRWLMESYRVYWEGQAIDPVSSMRGNRVRGM